MEKIAANAVMAGCRPEHMPVLIAAVEAIADNAYNLLVGYRQAGRRYHASVDARHWVPLSYSKTRWMTRASSCDVKGFARHAN